MTVSLRSPSSFRAKMPLANTMIWRQTTARAPNERSKKSLRSKETPRSGRSCTPAAVRCRKFVSLAGALGDVDVGAEPVARLAPLDVVGAQVDAQVGVRLDPRPEHGRQVEERRG